MLSENSTEWSKCHMASYGPLASTFQLSTHQIPSLFPSSISLIGHFSHDELCDFDKERNII